MTESLEKLHKDRKLETAKVEASGRLSWPIFSRYDDTEI